MTFKPKMLDTNGPDEADIDALTDQARHVLLGKELELDALVT